MTTETLLDEKTKRKKYMHEHYEANKEAKKAYSHAYYLANKETINKRNKEYYRKTKNAPSKKNFYRQKDILNLLSAERRNIGDTTYYLLTKKIEQIEKFTFKT